MMRFWRKKKVEDRPLEAVPSERLVQQRVRNRIMEAVLGHADWQDSRRHVDVYEHFEIFFDNFPYEGGSLPDPYSNETLTQEERAALAGVHALVKQAYDWLPHIDLHRATWDEYTATGWPLRIEPVAEVALKLMLKRGRFSEEKEEETPSADDGWPWNERLKLQ